MTAPEVGALPAAGVDPAAEQLAVLAPDLTLTIAGREVVVREYGFIEGLEVAHRAAAFITDMHALCSNGALRYDRIRRLFGVHQAVVVDIAAQSAGVESAWVRGLGRDESETFFSAWFGVNAGFFVHEVVVEMREERTRVALEALAAAARIGSAPSVDLLPPESATTTASCASPSDSSKDT